MPQTTTRLTRPVRLATVLVLVVSICVGLGAPAQAAPPSNDQFVDAATMDGPLPISVSGTNVDATKETGEPDHAGNTGGASIWYSWTPASSAQVAVSTCGSDFDTLLGVYTGDAVGALSPVASNDDACLLQSRVVLDAVAGTVYRIAIDGFRPSGGQPETGASQLRIEEVLTGPPPNDQFVDAETLDGPLPSFASGTNVDATKEPGEPDHAGNTGGASIWYSWTPASSARVAVSTCGSDFDTLLGVYTGDSVGALSPVASDDDSCAATFQSRAVLDAVAGTTYWIAIDGFRQSGGQAATGTTHLRIEVLTGPPSNDQFVDAETLDGPLPISVSGSNVEATKEAGEPDHPGDRGGASVWYSWTSSDSAVVTITAEGNAIFTLLAVYTGDSVGALTSVAFAASFPDRQAAVSFHAVADTTYHVAVDSMFLETGTFELVVRDANRPPNDDFAAAEALSGSLPITVPFTNVEATTEPGEPLHAGGFGGASVWYSWTSTATQTVVIDVCEGAAGTGPFDSVLAVYTGNSLGSLTELASGDDTCGNGSAVMFEAAAGTTYRIALDGVLYTSGIRTGEGELHVRTPAPPPNDSFSNPRVLRGTLPVTAYGTNVDASLEAGEPHHAGIGGGASVWYSWTPEASGRTSIDTCHSDFDTVLAVYTGESLGSLTTVDDSNDAPECGGRSVVSFDAVSGTTYRIAVDGFPDSLTFMGGLGTVIISIGGPPPNDDFEDAAVLDGELPVTSAGPAFNSHNAGEEAGEPDHAGAPGGHSLWYSWTPSVSGPVTIDTCGGTVDTLLAVYTGSSMSALTEVAANDDSCFLMSAVTFEALAGTAYRIAVAGFRVSTGDVSTGDIVLRIHEAGQPAPPPNDDFAAAHALPGAFDVLATATNLDATKEQDEPDHAGDPGGSSIWYSWTPPASGPVRIDTCGSQHNLQTLLAVYTGPSLSALTEVASDDRGTSVSPCVFHGVVTFDAIAGTTYWIAVDAARGLQDRISLAIRSTDTIAPQTSIDSGPSAVTSDTTPEFTFSSNEQASTFECSLDGAPFSSCNSGEAFGPLGDGNHTFAVRAIDSTGNADPSPATSSFATAACTMRGTPGNDSIIGTEGRDVICSGDGNDVVVSGPGDDVLFGEAGNDIAVSGPGDDHLDGGSGADRCNGGPGTDTAVECDGSIGVP